MSLPEHGSKVDELDQWILVLGGSGTVGQFAIQVGDVTQTLGAWGSPIPAGTALWIQGACILFAIKRIGRHT